MLKVLRGTSGERAFKAATLGTLVLLSLFVAGIIISLLSYTNWNAFLSALLSQEILFAIRLSLATATIATIISMLIAIPVAYTISQNNFPFANTPQPGDTFKKNCLPGSGGAQDNKVFPVTNR